MKPLKRLVANRRVLLLCVVFSGLLVLMTIRVLPGTGSGPADWTVSPERKKLVSDRVRAVLGGQCRPSWTRKNLMTQLPGDCSATEPFLWKDIPLPESLFLYPAPFGIQGHRSEVEDILKQLPNSVSSPLWQKTSGECRRCVVVQMLGTALCIIGWIGVIVVCALPQWKVTAFIGQNIVTAQTTWEGIWMTCVVQSTGQMQCKVYDSMLALSTDLQAARALTIVSILAGLFGLLLAIAGGKCTNCVEDEVTKAKVGMAAGAIFIIAGLLCLIPVSWTANTIIRNFYNPLLAGSQKMELGAALFIGWGASALLILGGALLCANCPPKDNYSAKYAAARSTGPKDYV